MTTHPGASVDVSVVAPGATEVHGERQVRLTLSLREFDLPPIRDGVIIGRRAPIGPRALLEALERMLPATYELILVEGHATVEAVIVRKSRLLLVSRDSIVRILLRHAEGMVQEDGMLHFEMQAELSVRVEVTR